jgi:hypothetical protein
MLTGDKSGQALGYWCGIGDGEWWLGARDGNLAGVQQHAGAGCHSRWCDVERGRPSAPMTMRRTRVEVFTDRERAELR